MLAGALLATGAPAWAGCRVEQRTMPVSLLQGVQERAYSVCLPESYDSDPDRIYPVLYLLHGGGDHHTTWELQGKMSQTVDRLVSEGKMEEMVIVCPEACEGNMIYFNMPEWRYEDYFFGELIPYMEKTYRISREKRYRSVAGLSMGGGGATVYGLHHPEMFNMVCDMSGYLRRQEIFGNSGDPALEARQRCVEENNPIPTVENGTPEEVRAWRTVRWLIDCGDHDFTLESNMDFVKALRTKGIDYEMRVRSGIHEWSYWQVSLGMALEYFTQNMYPSKVVDGGGSGAYPAVALTEHSLPDFVVYRPENLEYAAATEGPLPVLVFANGGCNNTSLTHEKVLSEIASHGYVVIALGPMQKRLDDREIVKAPDAMMYEAMDWILAQNADPESPYYGKIDPDHMAAGGQSCGGAQVMNVAADPRLKTYLMYNTGIGDMQMNGCSKEKLTNFHGPVLYIIGDDEDVAYANAIKDYARIKKTPVAFANLKDGGHMGTFAQPNGGSFARIALQWLDWQLKGRVSNSVVFLNGQLQDYPDWTVESKNFKKVYQVTDYTVSDLDCTSGGKRIWGEVFMPKGVKGKVPLVIIGHGYNSSWRETRPYAEALASRGVAACIFDFCGGSMTSRSEGATTEMSVFTESDDMVAIMDAARKWKGIDSKRIVIMGCSQGGLVASITGAAHPDRVHSMVLIYPAFNIGYDAVNRHPKEAIHSEKFNLMGLDISHVFYDKLLGYNVYEDIKKYRNPVVAIYGDRDAVTANNAMEKADASFGHFETRVISQATHGFPNPSHLKQAIDFTLDFIGTYVL